VLTARPVCTLLLGLWLINPLIQTAHAATPLDAPPPPIVNALGLALGKSVDESLLRERLAEAPDFVNYQPESDPVTPSRQEWYLFRAGTKPKVLENSPLRLATQLDSSNRVLRVDAALSGACAPLGQSILDILATKYSAPRPAADAWQLIDYGDHRIAWHCGGGYVHLSYLHLPAIEAAKKAAKLREDAIANELFALEEARARQIADRITIGSRGHLMGGMGITFQRSIGQIATDVLTDMSKQTPPKLALTIPFDAQIELKAGPEGQPYQIYAHIDGSDAPALFNRFDTALQTKYGSPHSGTPKRRIFRVNGDLIRLTHSANKLTLLFINQAGAIAARSRAKKLASAEAAKQAQQFDADTKGL